MKIVVIEDDVYLREEILSVFEKEGYVTAGITSFTAPEQEIVNHQPDLIVLDIGLPGKSGMDLCKWLKARTSFPVLILTARDTLEDELSALALGADDFLTKPCHPDRLTARARRLLRTYGQLRNIIQAGKLSLDTDTYKLIWDEGNLVLAETEGRILKLLMEKHPAVVTREELLSEIWGSAEFVDDNILQVNLTRLRKKLTETGLEDLIRTVRGKGYCLELRRL